ncbi:MAG: glutamate racemase [Treponema sp.]|nr:glutamate racemase [Treponema sp.]
MTDFVFIDSGVGGIPYMTTLLERSPDSRCVYVADSANFPYGEKSHEQVVECVCALVQKICDSFAPAVIVIACNTMSVNALDVLRARFQNVKFVGTVPAIKLAASVSKKRRIGLLATRATCQNPYNLELKNKFASDCELICRGDPELVSYIEHNAFTATRQECLQAVKPAVDFFRKNDCDVIILGCTHFLNITDVFEEACGSEIKVVDSVDGVVRHSIEVLGADCVEQGDGGVAGVSPAGRGSEQRSASEGNAFPSQTPKLFVTGFADDEEKKQYDVLCSRFGIEFNSRKF